MSKNTADDAAGHESHARAFALLLDVLNRGDYAAVRACGRRGRWRLVRRRAGQRLRGYRTRERECRDEHEAHGDLQNRALLAIKLYRLSRIGALPRIAPRGRLDPPQSCLAARPAVSRGGDWRAQIGPHPFDPVRPPGTLVLFRALEP